MPFDKTVMFIKDKVKPFSTFTFLLFALTAVFAVTLNSQTDHEERTLYVAVLIVFTANVLLLLAHFFLRSRMADGNFHNQDHIFRTLADHSRDMIFILTPDNRVQYINGIAAQMLKTTPKAIRGKKMNKLFPPQIDHLFSRDIRAVIQIHRSHMSQHIARFPERDIIVDSQWIPFTDETGQVKAVVAISRDISERKWMGRQLMSAYREKEIMLKEIRHRVKNNMQAIVGLLTYQITHAKNQEARTILKAVERRIASMAILHEKLSRAGDMSRIDFSEYIKTLAPYLLRSASIHPDHIDLILDLDHVEIHADTAIPCGLLVNELITNSLKHAFPDGRKGNVRVALAREEERYRLTVEDNGIGFPEKLDFKNAVSAGMQLIKTLTEQLSGTIEMERRDTGTSFTVAFGEYQECAIDAL